MWLLQGWRRCLHDELLLELIDELLVEVMEALLVELIDELLELVDETTLELLDDSDGLVVDLEPPPPHPTIIPPEMAKQIYKPIFDRIIKHLGFYRLFVKTHADCTQNLAVKALDGTYRPE
jgi:hypothetical protein